jgi:hypothetical protein
MVGTIDGRGVGAGVEGAGVVGTGVGLKKSVQRPVRQAMAVSLQLFAHVP